MPTAQNSFQDILLTNLKYQYLQRPITPEKIDGICSKVNLFIIPYQLTKFQAPSSNSFQEILLTSLKCPNLQRAITPEKFDGFDQILIG